MNMQTSDDKTKSDIIDTKFEYNDGENNIVIIANGLPTTQKVISTLYQLGNYYTEEISPNMTADTDEVSFGNNAQIIVTKNK
jgi:hypothetical protein